MVKTAKNAKKAPGKADKPITDFFTRRPAASQSSTVSDTASTRAHIKAAACSSALSSQTDSSSQKPVVVVLKTSSASNTRTDKPTPRAPSSPKKAMEHTRSKHTRTASLKRSRSPDAPIASTSSRQPLDAAQSRASQLVPTTPRKKTRLSSPASPSLSVLSLVPSSQSDEEELSMPSASSATFSRDAVTSWRKDAAPLTPRSGDDAERMDMDVDEPSAPPSFPPATPWRDGATTSSSNVPRHIMTPPYTHRSSDDLPTVPPTPVALDPIKKAAQMCEAVKAKARAAAQAAARNKVKEDVPDVLTDSDDEDDMPMLFARKASVAPSPHLPTSDAPQLRRSTRQRPSVGVSSTGSPISRRSRSSLSPASSSASKPSTSAKTRARPSPDPINLLLKEKMKREKMGKGSEAVRKAEAIVKKGRDAMLDEMSFEVDDLDYDSLKNGVAPPAFVLNAGYKSIGPLFLDEKDRLELFGKKTDDPDGYDGSDINAILTKDRATLEEEEREFERHREGVPLWTATSDAMAVDQEPVLPTFAADGTNAILRFLSDAMQKQDHARASWILRSGALGGLAAADSSSVINDLCVLATTCSLYSPPRSELSEAAFNSAMSMLNHTAKKPMVCPVSGAFVFQSMLELGASPSYLQSIGIEVGSAVRWPHLNSRLREAVLYRVVALTARAALSRRLIAEEIPSLVVALVVMAIDPYTTHELRRDITGAINDVCRSAVPVGGTDRGAESAIASRLVALAHEYRPVDKAALVSLLSGGTGATMRIARFVAHSIIVGYSSTSITAKTYCDPPPLSPLMTALLQPTKKDGGNASESDRAATPAMDKTIFTVDDDTNYVDMKFYANILGVATSNVKGWVAIQREKDKSKPKKFGFQPVVQTDLDLLHILLEDLHAAINDLRAAHLDRSRTKAAVKQLQMRVYYQRIASERALKNAEAVTMKGWLNAGKGSAKATPSSSS